MEEFNNMISYHASLTENVEIHNFDFGQVAVFTYPSTNIAEDNQDSAALILLNNNEIVLGLSDGAGGSPEGKEHLILL